MPRDAAATGAESDADSTQTGDQTSDAGTTGALTQADVDRIVAAKVSQKLKAYGDVEDLKRKAAQYDSLQESQKTETQKLTDKIRELEARDAQRETERQKDRVATATVREAARLGFRDPDDALAHVERRIDSVEFGDDGQPTNVGKLLSGLLKDKPYLASVNGSADGGQRGESSEGKQPTMSDLLRAAAGR
jgi:hypothetical protein